MTSRTVTIATRGSELALWQANHVRDAIAREAPAWTVELAVITTKGDVIQDVPLSKVGGKALFVKEIEQALLDRRADVAVHSMKDVPAELAPGLAMAAVSSREDPRDALCTAGGCGLDGLPAGARVGTSSLRRQCQLYALRPDLHVSMLRGNVPTRLGKLDGGAFDAVVLAAAGLRRLGHAGRISELLAPEVCLPAVGQGVLGIETRDPEAGGADGRDRDRQLWEVVRRALHDAQEERRVSAERTLLARLSGSCQTPLAAYATYEGGGLRLRGMCGKPDGSRILRAERTGPPAAAEDLGRAVAEDLLAQGAGAIIDECAAG